MMSAEGAPVTPKPPTEAELAELGEVARRVAENWLPMSARDSVGDVVQDSLIAYVEYASRKEVDNPVGVMALIAKRRAQKSNMDWKKNRRNEDGIGLDDEDGRGDGHHVVADIPGMGRTVERFENLDALGWAIEQLPADLRPIAELTFLGGESADGSRGEFNFLQDRLDAEEVASRLGLAVGTVRNRLVTIRRLLQDLLLDED